MTAPAIIPGLTRDADLGAAEFKVVGVGDGKEVAASVRVLGALPLEVDGWSPEVRHDV